MKTWKGNGNTTTGLFSPKGLEILYPERRTKVTIIMIENFNSIFLRKS